MSTQTLDPRRAYLVRRYHTWPVHHQQTVGEHSIQVWRILKAIWPDAPQGVLDYALTHDIGEGVAGDPPYPVKATNPVVKAEIDRIEDSARSEMEWTWKFPARGAGLSPIQQTVFKIAEYIEMWEFGLDEVSTGNSTARLIATRMLEQTKLKLAELVDHVNGSEITKNASAYIALRARSYENITGCYVP